MKVHKKAHHNHVLLITMIIFGLGFYAGQKSKDPDKDLTEPQLSDSGTPAQNTLPAEERAESIPPPRATYFKTNQACIDIIKLSESVHLKAYQGPSGKWLIGYGHGAGVKPGMSITQGQAEQYLKEDLRMIEDAIAARLKLPVSRNQFSAMVCLAYNIGTGSFATSTVLKETNAGNFQRAADAFLMWNKVSWGGKLVVNAHLDNRRKQERSLYLASD